MDNENVCEFNPNENTPHTVHVKDLPQGAHFIILDDVAKIELSMAPFDVDYNVNIYVTVDSEFQSKSLCSVVNIIDGTMRHIDAEEPVIPVNMEFGVYSIFNPGDKWHPIFKTRKENKIWNDQKH